MNFCSSSTFHDLLNLLKISILWNKKSLRFTLRLSVIPLGLEPKAYCLEGSCSIQLSYGTDLSQKLGAKVLIFCDTAKF